MMKKLMTVLIALMFVSGLLFIMASCGGKQVTQEPEVTQVTEEEKPEAVEKETPTAAEMAPPKEPSKPIDTAKPEDLTPLPEHAKVVPPEEAPPTFPNENIYFDFDKSELKPEARIVLRNMAAWLGDNPDYFLRIEGHCDERGTNEYNLALGERRARAAEKFISALGIQPTRTTSLSYGEERPVDPGHNEDSWAKNRRDEFVLLK